MSTTRFFEELALLEKRGAIPLNVLDSIKKFYNSYLSAAIKNGYSEEVIEPILKQLATFTAEQISNPYQFEPYHQKMIAPINYYRFGQDFIRSLVDLKHSKLYGKEILDIASEQVKRGENVIFFANHQIEPDPQVISLMLEPSHDLLGSEMIFVAGHRVTTDPLAIPFSLGRNLLCIHSKRHIEHPPEKKAEKQSWNQQTLKKLEQLLQEGGKSIYVAPSGGRDRPSEDGKIIPAPFDADSIELFHLIAKKAKTKTHFYPLALSTYHLLPPPDKVLKEIGEMREAAAAPVFLNFGAEIDMEQFDLKDFAKHEKRKWKADHIFNAVCALYKQLETL